MSAFALVKVTHETIKRGGGVDVPVAINFFNRIDTLEKVFSVIREVRPTKLFLIADGPRKNVVSDIEKTVACRKVVEEIDWDCEVYQLYAKENQGLWVTYFDAMKLVFNVVDRCIFLEDDVVVSKSFFEYCRYLLEKFCDDYRISFVTAINLLGEYEMPSGDYFFCGEGGLTAYGLWKRTFDSMNLNFCKDTYTIQAMMTCSRKQKPGYEKRIQKWVDNPYWQGHIPHVEVYKNLLRFSQSQICIVPTKNMVTNIGVGSGATHSANNVKKLPTAIQRIFNAERYEYEFPLKDPEFVVVDYEYEKVVNNVLAWNKPFVRFFRRIEAILRHIYYGDFSRVKNKIQDISSWKIKE